MVAKALFDELRSLGFGSISGSYANVGSATTAPCRAFAISNGTDGDMIFSDDGGTTDKFFVGAGAYKVWDVEANASQADDKFVLEVGTQFAVKQVTAPTSGSVYVEVLR